MKRRGLFITLEGIDGTGKTTQLRLLRDWLRRQGYRPLITREPGGTAVGEQIRRVLLSSRNGNLEALSELLLMYAARRQHLQEVVLPALALGEIVLSDRFSDASFAYQGYGRKLGEKPVQLLDRLVCGGIKPDVTLLLDLPARTALGRASKRDRRSALRRFEAQGVKFQERVRKGYLEIAKQCPGRIKLIRADAPVRDVHRQICIFVGELLMRRAHSRKSGASQPDQ